jgi:imidazolonepropionase-like amidohydrolase
VTAGKESDAMGDILFTNVRIFDGSGEHPFAGEVLVQGNRIRRIARGVRALPSTGVTVIDGAGATLMPGLCDAHCHISWNDATSLEAIQMMPVEEHMIRCIEVAKTLMDCGFTMAVGAAAAKPRLDVVIRNAINSGRIPGPRYLANGPEIGTLGGLGDTMPPHILEPMLNFGMLISGPEEMRKAVRLLIKYGVDLIKLNLSGEELTSIGADESPMAEEEIAMAVSEAKRRNKRVVAHARSNLSVKQCIKHGIEIIYHASYIDEEGLDLLEANKDKHFVAPALAWLIQISHHAGQWGISPDVARDMGYHRELEIAIEATKKMRRRGIRLLPGGDYGFAWTPHGTNAKDLEYFVNLCGFSPIEALVSATKLGGEIMGHANDLGQIKEGFLADLLLVDGDPIANIKILQDRSRLLAIMKDGAFHKQPELAPHRQRLVV